MSIKKNVHDHDGLQTILANNQKWAAEMIKKN